NATTGQLIALPTVATFLPLWAGVMPSRVTRLIARLRQPGCWPAWPVPSVPLDAAQFQPERYWQGPTWINMNWAIVHGLRQCDATDLAAVLRQRTIQLVDRSGFAEYFSPLNGRGFGAHNFSWTAALTLAFLDEAPTTWSEGET